MILSAKNYSLAEDNAEASRQLEQLREAASRLRALASSGHGSIPGVAGHDYSSSSSSNHAPPTPSRSPLSTSRVTPLVSPSPDHHAIEQARRVIKSEEQHPSVAKKFKWGKGKTETNRPMHPPPLPFSISKATSSSRSAPSSSDSKSHVFQQTSILRPVRCEYCGDKMWGLNEVRCTSEFLPIGITGSKSDVIATSPVCGCYSHAKCAGYLQGSCSTSTNEEEVIGPNPNGLVMFGNNLVRPTSLVPKLDAHCPCILPRLLKLESKTDKYQWLFQSVSQPSRHTASLTPSQMSTLSNFILLQA